MTLTNELKKLRNFPPLSDLSVERWAKFLAQVNEAGGVESRLPHKHQRQIAAARIRSTEAAEAMEDQDG